MCPSSFLQAASGRDALHLQTGWASVLYWAWSPGPNPLNRGSVSNVPPPVLPPPGLSTHLAEQSSGVAAQGPRCRISHLLTNLEVAVAVQKAYGDLSEAPAAWKASWQNWPRPQPVDKVRDPGQGPNPNHWYPARSHWTGQLQWQDQDPNYLTNLSSDRPKLLTLSQVSKPLERPLGTADPRLDKSIGAASPRPQSLEKTPVPTGLRLPPPPEKLLVTSGPKPQTSDRPLTNPKASLVPDFHPLTKYEDCQLWSRPQKKKSTEAPWTRILSQKIELLWWWIS